LDKFLELGIDTFYDLTVLDELPPYLPILREEASERGIKIQHIRFPILDRNIPPRGMMMTILDVIGNALAKGHNVYLHCWGGIGRTGTTVGCYLVRRGLTGEQALERLAEWWKDVPKSSFCAYTPETDQQKAYILNWWENLPATPPSPEPPTRPVSKRISATMNRREDSTHQANWTRKLRARLFRRTSLVQFIDDILSKVHKSNQ
jgi:protein-tyrosine phosphatase